MILSLSTDFAEENFRKIQLGGLWICIFFQQLFVFKNTRSVHKVPKKPCMDDYQKTRSIFLKIFLKRIPLAIHAFAYSFSLNMIKHVPHLYLSFLPAATQLTKLAQNITIDSLFMSPLICNRNDVFWSTLHYHTYSHTYTYSLIRLF